MSGFFKNILTRLSSTLGANLVGTDDGKTAQERIGLIQTQNITAGLALRIKGFFRNLAAFSTGGSFGVGDWSDGEAINQHAGDDGTTTRVVAVRAQTAPLFLGITNRPNGEAGGDVGRSIASFEGIRMANDVGYRDMGALRIISEGATVGRYGGRVAILTRPNGVSTVADFKERFAVHANGDILVGGGVGSANRTGVPASSVCVTVSGQTTHGVIELTTPAPDAASTMAGELLFVVNQNTGGDKRIARIFAITTGTTAGNRGGELALQVKPEGGAPIEAMRLKSNGDAYVTGGLRTGAPALGTLGQWKFGRAQVVAPTAPNRTIELEVDGVIYYLAAKTTNN